ncbi:MAG TPA: GNAT family N-acetyltransferase [Frankiaceae bacterium]|nr:GNAT family N-acetyltransferase [Frankiaceae bacterium]
MAKELILRDGTPAMVWSVSPSDARGLAENYAHLSDRTRYRRFLSPIPRLSPELLRLLVDTVDGVDHVALILVVFPSDEPERAVGIARMIRLSEDATAADVAVTVVDEWQGRGVASALLAELMENRPVGVRTIRTQVGAENQPSLAMLRRLGDIHLDQVGSGVYDVQVDLEQQAGAPTQG